MMDERVCCDTIFRAVRVSPKIFVVYDLLVLNGTRVHDTLTFQERQDKLDAILDQCHFPDLSAFVNVHNAPIGCLVRGTEYYDNQPGSIGVFTEELS